MNKDKALEIANKWKEDAEVMGYTARVKHFEKDNQILVFYKSEEMKEEFSFPAIGYDVKTMKFRQAREAELKPETQVMINRSIGLIFRVISEKHNDMYRVNCGNEFHIDDIYIKEE